MVIADGTVSVDYDVEGADESGGYYILDEGDTYNMRVEVEYNPEDSGTYNLQLLSVGYAEYGTSPTDSVVPSDLGEYESDSAYVAAEGSDDVPYSQAAYYNQGSYYSQSSYYSESAYYNQGSYYSQASYYNQGSYYSQGSYWWDQDRGAQSPMVYIALERIKQLLESLR